MAISGQPEDYSRIPVEIENWKVNNSNNMPAWLKTQREARWHCDIFLQMGVEMIDQNCNKWFWQQFLTKKKVIDWQIVGRIPVECSR